MNKLVQWLILRKIKQIKKEVEMKRYNWKKTLEKFLRGGGIAFVGTVIATWKGYDPKVVVPLFTAFGEALWNIIKFFYVSGNNQ